jgi:hypothetical protein
MFIIGGVFWFVLTRLRCGNWTLPPVARSDRQRQWACRRRGERTNFIVSAFFAGLPGCMQFAYIAASQGQDRTMSRSPSPPPSLAASLFGTGTIWAA